MNSKNPPFKLKPGVKVEQSIPDPAQVEQNNLKVEHPRTSTQRSFKKSMLMQTTMQTDKTKQDLKSPKMPKGQKTRLSAVAQPNALNTQQSMPAH